jgi:hypothetical protein
MMDALTRFPRRLGGALVVALLVLGGSCRDMPTAPPSPPKATEPSQLLGLNFGQPRLLYCPSSETLDISGQIGLDGGTLSLGGTSVTIPGGDLLDLSTVRLTIPAGQYMEVDLTVNGGHFIFPQPVVLTIDYSRCNRWETLFRLLSVWNIDQDTKALIENEGGIDNKLTQSITVLLSHFSGFAIAY